MTSEAASGLAQAAIDAGIAPDPRNSLTHPGPAENGHHEPEPVTEAAPGSVLAMLRARAKSLREEKTTDLDIPGYDGYLVGRYRAVSLARIFARSTGVQTPLTIEWTTAADTLATALVELFMRDSPDGELHPLFKDQPARFDDDLVECLALVVTQRTARAVLVALCGGDELGESRVWSHYMAFQGWLMAGEGGEPAEGEVAKRAVGESTAG